MTKIYLKTYWLTLTFILAITFSFSQKNKNFNYFSDSLAGFNESAARQEMLIEGIDPLDYEGILFWKKRDYINKKFYSNYNSNSTNKVITQNNFINAAPCVNEGFESNVLAPWLGSRGTNTSSCSYPVTSTTIGLGAPHLQINTTPFVDGFIGLIPNSPFTGNKVLKLNDGLNNNPFFNVVKASQTFSVTSTNFLYEFAYIMVTGGQPTNNHVCCDMPYMYVRIRDALGILQSCPNFSILPPATNSAACLGIGPTSWSSLNIGPNNYIYNNAWQKYSIDLTNYMNSNVTVEVIVSDCSGGAHFGYSYFDSNCNDFGITLNNSTVYSAPTQTVNIPALCATTATLTAPSGLSPYLWNGPAASAVTNNTNQTISTSVPGDYTLQMTPVGVCNPITRIVRLKFVPPLGAFATPTAICSAGSNTTSILTATGATSYTWSTSSNSSTISVSPSSTTIYTVTGNTSTCTTTQTVQVTVNPSPTVSANTSTNVLCSGGNATLTATGAATYTWFPGSIIGTSIVVTPTASITYTVLGDNGGCPGAATVAISVISSPTVTAFSSPTTICVGGSANLIAGGALTFTWQPGNLVGSNVVVTPASTTIYTVTGSLLSCTDTETVQVSTSNGPTLTIVSNPTVLCSASGGNATLSASGAVSYTWNPGAIISPSIVITPTATTIYSVTGSNSLTCLTTNTISFSVTPTPTLNIVSSSTAICAGNSATLTGSGATNYTWNPGALNTAVVIVSPASNTTYTLTGANGSCTSSLTVSLVVNANPTVTASSSPTVVCSGNSSTLSALGALTFTWNPGNLNGANVTVTPGSTTNYTVTGSNLSGCTASAVAMVSVNITPTLNPVSNPTAICIGGTATLSTGGATTYTWNPGNLSGSSVTVSPIIATVYTVTGSNGSCSDTKTLSLPVNPIPTVSAVSNPTVICSGNSATLTAIGATSYTWNPGSLTGSAVSVNPLVNTTYTVVGSNGTCSSSAVVSLSVNASPTLIATSNPTSICVGASSTATLNGNGALSYTWNPGLMIGSTVTVSPAASTIYTLTGTNAALCQSSTTVSLLVIPIPTINVSASQATICSGNSTTLMATGATNYTWNPGSLSGGTVVVTPLTNTTYTVFGANASCTSTNVISIVVNSNPTITANSSPTLICSGSTSTLSALGALTFTWNPGSIIGANVTVTPAITTQYTVIGTNASGCTASAVTNVSVNTTPTINPVATPTAICIGSSSTLTATGATNYTWNPGAITGSNISVAPIITTVYTVTGANGNCTDTKTVLVVVNPIPTVTAVSNPTLVCASTSATLTGSGATSYTWLPGSLTGTNVVVNPTITTTYTVIGSSLSCTNTATVIVNVNATPTIIALASTTNICSNTGGTSTLTATGAVNYTWNPGAITGSNIVVTPTASITYTVIGSSVAGCISSQTVSILITPSPTLNPISSPTVICSGASATLSTSGATTYTWNPGVLTGSSVVVSPTSTTVYTVTGVNGICSTTSTVSLVVNPNPTVSAASNPTAICSGGTATLTANGATNYTWNPGSVTGSVISVNPNASTTYTVVGSNASGCLNTTTVNLIVNPTPTITIVASATSICSGNTTTLTAFGANSYTWNPTAVTNSVLNVAPPVGSTIFTVTGLTGNCSSTKTIQIIVTPVPTLTAVSNPTLKCGASSATLSATGATSYTWNPGSLSGGTVVVSPGVTTNYTVIGSNGSCTSSAFVTLSVAPTPTANTFANPINLCSGNSSTVGAFGFGVVSYTWNPGAIVAQTIVVTPTATTIYTVTYRNAAGCTNTATRTVFVNPSPTVVPVANPSVICFGQSTTLTATGANNYTWTPGPIISSVIVVSPTVSTTYTVRGNNGPCINITTISVIVNPSPTITAAASSTLVCASSAVTLTSIGASTYTWQPGSLTGGTVVVNPLVNTTYTVTGSNSSNCTNTAIVTVSISPGPTISIAASSTSICAGNTITLTPSGATNYTLYPGAVIGTSFAVTPTTSTTYTILGGNSIGCAGVNTIQIIVNPIPTITITPSSNGICIGTTVTLTATGANTYTWMPPISAVTPTIIDTPTITTTYTVVGTNAAGCNSTQTITITVTPIPTITASSSASVVCQSGTISLSATGATNFTWMPGSLTGSNVIATPTITTTYTVTGNSGGCSSTATILINVTPGPTGITASSTGTITCLVTSVGLLGNTTSTNVSYSWNGPASFTSAVQNPTPVIIPGTYTLTVTDLDTGCPLSSTTAVIGNTSIPNFTATSSGDLGCNTSVTISASSSNTTSVVYSWNGPSSFTSSLQSETISVAGDYTVVAFDPITGCSQTLVVSVLSNTDIPVISATIIAATCNGTVTNNNGTIILGGNGVKYDYVTGATYTGSAVYVSATPIPTNGVITNTLVNPTTLTPYTVRIFGSNGCFKDTTLFLQPINCFNNVFGLTKAASAPIMVNNKYNVTYTVTLVNNSFADLTNIVLNENLDVTFPLPSTYSVIAPPVVTSQGSSLTINPSFNGSSQISLTSPLTSTLLAARRDTIVFTVQIDPKGFFGPFKNSVIGFANDVNSLVVTDSSNDGFLWDPDLDGFPTNNNIPTIINFAPNTRLGIAKAGVLSAQLSDKTYDITYVVTVKNFGNDTLKNVQVIDNLALTVLSPAQFSIKNAPSVTGTLLTGNAAFNGISNMNLISGFNTFAPGDVDTIKFTINVKPDTVTIYKNTAFGMATNQFATVARDSSETGYNADSNGDGNPNEVSDSDPTIIIINSSEFEIPEVFTPNDDGKNDFFVIKGLGSRKLKITVFNRWGNKVYESLEYDNKWNGYPNASGIILGNNKLPQATYYYVAEFMDGDKEVKTGYVVIQY